MHQDHDGRPAYTHTTVWIPATSSEEEDTLSVNDPHNDVHIVAACRTGLPHGLVIKTEVEDTPSVNDQRPDGHIAVPDMPQLVTNTEVENTPSVNDQRHHGEIAVRYMPQFPTAAEKGKAPAATDSETGDSPATPIWSPRLAEMAEASSSVVMEDVKVHLQTTDGRNYEVREALADSILEVLAEESELSEQHAKYAAAEIIRDIILHEFDRGRGTAQSNPPLEELARLFMSWNENFKKIQLQYSVEQQAHAVANLKASARQHVQVAYRQVNEKRKIYNNRRKARQARKKRKKMQEELAEKRREEEERERRRENADKASEKRNEKRRENAEKAREKEEGEG